MTFVRDFYLPDFTWDKILQLFSRNLQAKYLFNHAKHSKRLVLYYILPSFI